MDIDEEEFIKIIDQNDARIWHLCRLYARDNAEKQDLYQEIVIQVWESLQSFNGEAKLSTWIYRLALNTAISMKRKRKTRRHYHSNFKKEKEAPHPTHIEKNDPVEENEQVKKLYTAIAKLNDSEKAIITMCLEGFTYAEIAYVTNITENYVGVKINRIKDKLSKLIKN